MERKKKPRLPQYPAPICVQAKSKLSNYFLTGWRHWEILAILISLFLTKVALMESNVILQRE